MTSPPPTQDAPSKDSQDAPLLLTQLPSEVLENIVSQLRNRDIKQLRLACRHFARVAVLRIHRVFLSANPLNIQVFRAIADHEGYRHGVVELVYDDARLPRSGFDVNAARFPYLHSNPWQYESAGHPGDREWFFLERSWNVEGRHDAQRKLQDPDLSPRERARLEQAAVQMRYEACWEYYRDLVRQQDEVIASNADTEALVYGLERFPSLRTIIVTPAAHGRIFEPFYETPMIRSFPHGFNYYVPRGWPTRYGADVRQFQVLVEEPGPWTGEDESLCEKIRSQWRGCLLVFRALAQSPSSRVSELLIDANQLDTGISCRMFDEPCDAYADLVAVLERPEMRRFHIALLVDHQWGYEWSSFRSGLLRRALAKCVGMEHFSLTTDMYWDEQEWHTFPPLETVIPIDCWPRLQHLKLWNLLVKVAEVINFLAQLPQTLRSLELSSLRFYEMDNGEGYYSLLSDMRSTLDWRERPIQPHVKIAANDEQDTDPTVTLWIEEEVDEYLYGVGDNPFRENHPSQPRENIGIMRDSMYPDADRPLAEINAEREMRWERKREEWAEAQQQAQAAEADKASDMKLS